MVYLMDRLPYGGSLSAEPAVYAFFIVNTNDNDYQVGII